MLPAALSALVKSLGSCLSGPFHWPAQRFLPRRPVPEPIYSISIAEAPECLGRPSCTHAPMSSGRVGLSNIDEVKRFESAMPDLRAHGLRRLRGADEDYQPRDMSSAPDSDWGYCLQKQLLRQQVRCAKRLPASACARLDSGFGQNSARISPTRDARAR